MTDPSLERLDLKDVLIQVTDGVGWVKINRGDGRNALRPQTLHGIAEAMDELTADVAVGAIVLTGEGRHFAAGRSSPSWRT